MSVTDEERRRIQALQWPELAGQHLFRRARWWSRNWQLGQRREGGCVFLTPGGRCRIHERLGAEAKPLACRLFPFVLVPAGDHWRAGLRFACPSVAADRGRPLTVHAREVEQLARLLEQQEGGAITAARPPVLQTGQPVAWRDLLRFVQAVLRLLKDRGDPLERRWRKCLALAGLCRQAKFEQLTGARLTEFLDVVTAGLEGEVAVDPARVAPPSWIGRVLFRQVAALLGRKDQGQARGEATLSRWRRLAAGWRFHRARGPVPGINGYLRPGVTFADLESPAGPLPPTAELVLERYYLVKVESLQFCGPTGFGLGFWDGLEMLALTLPVILWLARATAASDPTEALMQAVGVVDDHFGFNRALRSGRYRLACRLLAGRREVERLIAWYNQ